MTDALANACRLANDREGDPDDAEAADNGDTVTVDKLSRSDDEEFNETAKLCWCCCCARTTAADEDKDRTAGDRLGSTIGTVEDDDLSIEKRVERRK